MCGESKHRGRMAHPRAPKSKAHIIHMIFDIETKPTLYSMILSDAERVDVYEMIRCWRRSCEAEIDFALAITPIPA